MSGRLTAALAVGAVVASTALLTPTAAAVPPAAPTPPPTTSTEQPDSVGFTRHKITFSSAENRALKAVAATIRHGVDSKKRVDYRKAKHYFGSHHSDLYAFGAGWWSRRKDWGQFTHLSTGDKKNIIAWSKTHKGPNPKLSASSMHAMAPKPCTGWTHTFWNNADWQLVQYWNSCDTNTVRLDMDVCVPTAAAIGAIAVFVGKSGTLAVGNALIGLGCGAFSIYLKAAQDASTLNATIVQAFPRDGGEGSFAPTRYVLATPQ